MTHLSMEEKWGKVILLLSHLDMTLNVFYFTEQMRQQKRQLNKAQRELTRDRNALDRQEKQLVSVNLDMDVFTFLLLW